MKLELSQTAVRGEEWKRENRQPRTYPPPNDGREWMLMDEAAALFGIKLKSMWQKAGRIGFTRTARRGVKGWLLKKEVIDYLAFTKDRDGWYKRRRPKCWKPMIGSCEGDSDEEMQRVFWTARQAAAFMGVSTRTISQWAKSGKIPVFYNRKMSNGRRHWYSPTSLRNYKEDEERLKRQAIYEKAKATLRTGTVGREVYKQKHKPQVYRKPIPPGWLTVREAAELLGVSLSAIHTLRKRGGIVSEQFTGKWDTKHRPWFISRTSLEAHIQTEHYQRKHWQGLEATQKRIGTSDHISEPVTFTKQHEPHPADEQATLGCRYDVVPSVKEERTTVRDSPSLW